MLKISWNQTSHNQLAKSCGVCIFYALRNLHTTAREYVVSSKQYSQNVFSVAIRFGGSKRLIITQHQVSWEEKGSHDAASSLSGGRIITISQFCAKEVLQLCKKLELLQGTWWKSCSKGEMICLFQIIAFWVLLFWFCITEKCLPLSEHSPQTILLFNVCTRGCCAAVSVGIFPTPNYI